VTALREAFDDAPTRTEDQIPAVSSQADSQVLIAIQDPTASEEESETPRRDETPRSYAASCRRCRVNGERRTTGDARCYTERRLRGALCILLYEDLPDPIFLGPDARTDTRMGILSVGDHPASFGKLLWRELTRLRVLHALRLPGGTTLGRWRSPKPSISRPFSSASLGCFVRDRTASPDRRTRTRGRAAY